MARHFNPPPGWPRPPAGWVPPVGWSPNPSWPPAPPGWKFWIEIGRPEPAPSVARLAPVTAASPATSGPGGLFGGKKRQLETENADLRAALDRSGALPAVVLVEERRDLEAQVANLRHQAAQVQQALAEARAGMVETEEIALLQEAGIYQYAHPLEHAVGYKGSLARVRADTKTMIKAGNAVLASTNWTVNASVAQGRQMVSDFSKLLLRAYNAEADNWCEPSNRTCVRRGGRAAQPRQRPQSSRLGKTMDIRVSRALPPPAGVRELS